jgi:hypothetical protein
MGLMQRLRRLDQKAGLIPPDGRAQSRRDYLDWLARRRLQAHVPPEVYAELVELHDRVARLEAEVASLRRRRV